MHCKNYEARYIGSLFDRTAHCGNCSNCTTKFPGAVPGNWCRNFSEKEKFNKTTLNHKKVFIRKRINRRKVIRKKGRS